MGYGLILAGMGKGISDAGTTMMAAKLEEAKENRLMARTLALDEIKAVNTKKREEEALRRDAEIVSQAEANAPDIGSQRRFEKFKADVGQTDASDEQLRKVFDAQYNQREVGDFEGADRYVEPYSKQREDVLNEIRKLGGSSTAIKEGRETVKLAQTAEQAATKEARDARRLDLQERRIEQQGQYQAGLVDARMRQAEAAGARANRPAADKGGSQERLTTMMNTANQTIRSLNESPKGRTQEEKAEWERQMTAAKRLRDNAQSQLNKLFDDDGKPAGASAKTTKVDNGTVKSKPMTIPEPKTSADFGKLSPGTRYKAPDGTIRIKS